MIGWYETYLLALLVLWLFSSPRDRMALRVVLIAAILSEAMKYGVTVHIARAWKLVVFNGVGEALTLLALLRWAPNRSGYMQGACVAVALVTQLVNYAGIEMGVILTYDRYVTIIKLVAVAQILFFHDTISHNLRQLGHWLDTLRPRRVGALRPASVRSALLPDPRSPRV